MGNVLVQYYSETGHTQQMAELVAQGAAMVPGIELRLKNIEESSAKDVLWADDAYHEVFNRSGLKVVATYKPLADENEPYPWVNETRIAPWVIYVLKNAENTASRA